LPAADGNHGVDWFQSCLQRLLHRLTVNNTGGNAFDRGTVFCDDGTFAIDRLGESIHDTADQRFTDRYLHDAAGAANLIAFSNFCVVAEQHDSDLAFFQVQRKAHNPVRELQQFAGHRFLQAVDAGNSIADRDNVSDFAHIDTTAIVFNL